MYLYTRFHQFEQPATLRCFNLYGANNEGDNLNGSFSGGRMRSGHGGIGNPSNSDTYQRHHLHGPSDRRFYYEQNYFCSRSEAACAALMEKYLGFKTIDGTTFQVPIGRSADGHERHIDFLFHGVAFEYHPFHPPKTPHYWKLLYRLKPGERQQFRDGWSRNDTIIYYDKRRGQLDKNKKFKSVELVVARSAEEFYEKIILRFAPRYLKESAHVPTLEIFLAEFKYILGEVQELWHPRLRRIHIRSAFQRNCPDA